MRTIALACLLGAVVVSATQPAPPSPASPAFELVQPDLFSVPGGQPNAWADVDNDGDLDLFVGFRGRPNRLYRQTDGRFEDVAAAVGLADAVETRAAAWGDFNADGRIDLYVGFADASTPARIYRNELDGRRFTNVASELGIDLRGVSRQPAWVDYDGDGDLDLFAAFRDKPNRLLRNDGARFVDVSKETGIDDPRKTVGGVWWDFDRDGDLDLFVANQEGDANGLFRNDRGRFTDVADAMGVSAAGRPKEEGGVGPAVADYDLDGDLDLFVANYGLSVLYRNENGTRFVDVSKEVGITGDSHKTTAAWGDVNDDGRPDLYLAAFLADQPHYRDELYLNAGGEGGRWSFVPALPELLLTHDATHGVQLIDFDRDGRLDLSLTNNDPKGSGHPLLRNAGKAAARGFSVLVRDTKTGSLTHAGAEIRVFAPGSRRLLASGLIDSGSGYCAQNAAPVHIGLPPDAPAVVSVEVTVVGNGQRHATRLENVTPAEHRAQPLVIRAGR
jgi:hypothetical protein